MKSKDRLKKRVINCMMRNCISAEDYLKRRPYRSKDGYRIEQIIIQSAPVVINFDSVADSIIKMVIKEVFK
jgi:pyruvate-formate lyase